MKLFTYERRQHHGSQGVGMHKYFLCGDERSTLSRVVCQAEKFVVGFFQKSWISLSWCWMVCCGSLLSMVGSTGTWLSRVRLIFSTGLPIKLSCFCHLPLFLFVSVALWLTLLPNISSLSMTLFEKCSFSFPANIVSLLKKDSLKRKEKITGLAMAIHLLCNIFVSTNPDDREFYCTKSTRRRDRSKTLPLRTVQYYY